MKKLLTNLLLAILLNGFIAAAPTNANSVLKGSNISKMDVAGGYNGHVQEAELEIHPLDILALKFN